MSTYEQTHQVIIGGDFSEEITNINTTARQKYVVEFMAEHQATVSLKVVSSKRRRTCKCTLKSYDRFTNS